MTTVKVGLADAPTDVLVHLVGIPTNQCRTMLGITEAVAPKDAVGAEATTANALRLLLDMGYVESILIDDWQMFRATLAGRLAVAEAVAKDGAA